MKRVTRVFGVACDSDSGATAVEYAILSSLIAAVIVVVVGLIGLRVFESFQSVPPF